MALKKAAPTKSPETAAVAVAEPVVETPVPVDSGAAEQTPALQPVEPVVISEADVAAASITPAVIAEAEVAPAAIAEAEVEGAVAASLAELEAEPAAEPEDGKVHFVEVQNLRKTAFRQPSTGLWIQAGEVKYLAVDGWLENHVRANLLGQPEA